MIDFPENLTGLGFDDYLEVGEVSVKGISESAKYYQKLVSKLDLVDNQEAKRLARKIQLGKTVQKAMDYAEWAELTVPEDFIERRRRLIMEAEHAKQKLVVGNLRLVAHIARLTMGWVPYGSGLVDERGESIFKGAIINNLADFSGAPLPIEDRIQEGTLGLIKAVENYHPEKGAAFVTYSYYSIENAIARAIDYDRRIKIPVHQTDRIRKIGRTQLSLGVALGREPTIDEISEKAGLSWHHVQEALEAQKTTMQVESLQVIMPEDHDQAAALEETFRQPGEQLIDYDVEYLEQAMIEDEIDELLRVFDDGSNYEQRLKDILVMRYGLATGLPMTLEEIARQMDLTRERIRQLEYEGLEIMKNRALQGRHGVMEKAKRDRLKQKTEEKQKRERYARSLRIAAQIVRSAHQAAAGSR